MTSGAVDLARVRVDLAAATPLAELQLVARDLSRVQPLLEQVLGAAAELLQAPAAVLWLLDPGGSTLHPQAWRGLPDEAVAGQTLDVTDSLCGRAVRALDAVGVVDVLDEGVDRELREHGQQHGWRACLSTPMVTTGRSVVGTMCVYWPQPHQAGDRERGLVAAYAGQAAEIVERARLYGEARERAVLERQRATQLRALADHALAISAADTLDDLLRLVVEAAREVIGCHQGVTSRLPNGWTDATTYVSLSEEYAQYRDYDQVPEGKGVLEFVVRENKPLRLDGEALVRHPEWRGLRDAPGHPPMPDYLAAPLVGRDGSNLGLVQLSHKVDGTSFTAEDEAILVQLAQLTSSAIERLEALEGERAARQEAETAATVRGLLADVSTAFAASLDADEVVQALLRGLVPWLGEFCVVHLVDREGRIRRAGLRHVDPDLEVVLTGLSDELPPSTSDEYGIGAALRTGQAQLFPKVPEEVIRSRATTEPQRERLRRLVRGGGIVVPLVARGRIVGALTIGRSGSYSERELQWTSDLAGRAAQALDNAERFAFERSLAVQLQRSLLPAGTPTSALTSAAARYLPGARGTRVGGDWYDLVELDDGALLLVVGDVMGRGIKAAAVMGQLRAAVRAYALEGHGPAGLLQRLDRVVQSLDELQLTTCCIGRLEPETGRLRIARAGHPPPLVAHADGSCQYLELDPGLPLGVGGARYVEREVHLERGATVLLYTDGLVEAPDRPVEQGMDDLAKTVCSLPVRSAEELCDRVLRALGLEDGADDDTALLALRLVDEPDQAPLVLDLPALPQSAAAARAALRGLLGPRAETDAGESALLLLTELVSNAVRHAGGEVRLRAGVRDDLLLVEVCDAHDASPVVRDRPHGDLESGRGMVLVEALADRWGSDALPSGKRVWFEVALT